MNRLHLLTLLILALFLAPFGRVAAAEAREMPGHSQMQMAGHCAGQSGSGKDSHQGETAIDCMIACAAMTPGAPPLVRPLTAALVLPVSAPASSPTGIQPEADPPPPRLA